MTEVREDTYQQEVTSQQERIQRRVEWLIQQTKRFRYEEISRETLERGGRFRKLERIAYRGGLRQEQQEQESDRELLQDRDGSYVLALTDTEEVVFLLQVRPGLAQPYQVELPAGGLDENEEPLVNAIKELIAEAGASSISTIEELGVGPVFAGRSPQRTHFFLMEGVVIDPQKQTLEKGELIIPFTVPLEDAMLFASTLMDPSSECFTSGVGVDPKIIAALNLAAGFYKSQGREEMVRQILSI